MKIIFLIEDIVPESTELVFKQQPYLKKYNFDAEIWDVRFICGKVYDANKIILSTNYDIKIRVFQTKDEFVLSLKSLVDSIFYTNYKLTFKNLYVYKYLKINGIRYVIKKNKSHLLSDSISSIRFTRKKLTRHILNFVYRKFNAFFFRNFPFINEPLISLIGTDSDSHTHNFPIRNTRKIYAHNYEYEKVIFNNSITSNEKINLFLDQYLPFHPETFSEGIDPAKYYGSINKFLIELSKHTGLPSVVAAHPRSNVKDLEPYFEESIKIEILNTTNLIKNSKYVIGHVSTAVLQVLVLRKQYLIITTNALLKTSVDKAIKKLSELLNLNAYNIDSMDHLAEMISESNSVVLNEIFYKYIKAQNTPECSEWDILFAAINENITIESQKNIQFNTSNSQNKLQ